MPVATLHQDGYNNCSSVMLVDYVHHLQALSATSDVKSNFVQPLTVGQSLHIKATMGSPKYKEISFSLKDASGNIALHLQFMYYSAEPPVSF